MVDLDLDAIETSVVFAPLKRETARELIAELRTLRARVAEMERDARLVAAVREAAERVESVEIDRLGTGWRQGMHITSEQYDVLCSVADALRAEEGGE